jgi:hypothetical protein
VTPGPCEILDGCKPPKGGWKLSAKWADAIAKWGAGAKDYLENKPGKYQRALIISWGAGCNGDASCWKKNSDKFKDAYRAIQRAIIAAVDGGAGKPATLSKNITWVFQIEVPDGSTKGGGTVRFEDFYPIGPVPKEEPPTIVNWIGVSVFGAGGSTLPFTPLAAQFGPYYQRIREMAADKPIIMAAFGCPDTLDSGSACWAREALWALIHEAQVFPKPARQFPRVIGFAWFNSCAPFRYCVTDATPAQDPRTASLPLEHNSIVAGVFRRLLAHPRVFSWPVFVRGN